MDFDTFVFGLVGIAVCGIIYALGYTTGWSRHEEACKEAHRNSKNIMDR